MSLKYTSVPSKRLAESITASATSFRVSDIEGWDGNDLTSADFGTELYAIFRDVNSTVMEIMKVDPATIASSSITITLRGLNFTGDLSTELTARKLEWVRGTTIVEFGSPSPQLFQFLKEYIDGIAVAGAPKADLDTQGLSFLTDDLGDYGRAVAALVTRQVVVGMTLQVKPFKLVSDDKIITYAGGNTGTITAPVTNPRVDLVVYSTASSAIAVRGGTEAASPVAPTPTEGDIVLASVFLRTGTTGIYDTDQGTNGYIQTWYRLGIYRNRTNNVSDYAADGGSTDAYAITLTPAPTTYATGMTVKFKANTANTGAATLNVNSLGVKTIKKYVNQDLSDGDIRANQFVTVIYDGTNFQMISQGAVTRKVVSTTTEVSITNGAGGVETTLCTLAIPGNTLRTTNAIRFSAFFSTIGYDAGGDNLDLRVKIGATTFATITIADSAGSMNIAGQIDGMIIADATTNLQKAWAFFKAWAPGDAEVAGDAVVGINKMLGTGNNMALAVDATTDLNFVLTAQYSGTGANNDLTFEACVIEVVE